MSSKKHKDDSLQPIEELLPQVRHPNISHIIKGYQGEKDIWKPARIGSRPSYFGDIACTKMLFKVDVSVSSGIKILTYPNPRNEQVRPRARADLETGMMANYKEKFEKRDNWKLMVDVTTDTQSDMYEPMKNAIVNWFRNEKNNNSNNLPPATEWICGRISDELNNVDYIQPTSITEGVEDDMPTCHMETYRTFSNRIIGWLGDRQQRLTSRGTVRNLSKEEKMALKTRIEGLRQNDTKIITIDETNRNHGYLFTPLFKEELKEGIEAALRTIVGEGTADRDNNDNFTRPSSRPLNSVRGGDIRTKIQFVETVTTHNMDVPPIGSLIYNRVPNSWWFGGKFPVLRFVFKVTRERKDYSCSDSSVANTTYLKF